MSAVSQQAIILSSFITKAKKQQKLRLMAARKLNNPDDGKLKVLVDPAAQKLAMNTYKEYVSEEDFSDIVLFLRDFDALLAKFRKDKPLSGKEIEKIEQSQESKEGKDKADKGDNTPPADDLDDKDSSEEYNDDEPEYNDNEPEDSDDSDDEDEEEEPEDKSVVISTDLKALKSAADASTKAAEDLRKEIEKSSRKKLHSSGVLPGHEKYEDYFREYQGHNTRMHELVQLQKQAAKDRVAYRRASQNSLSGMHT